MVNTKKMLFTQHLPHLNTPKIHLLIRDVEEAKTPIAPHPEQTLPAVGISSRLCATHVLGCRVIRKLN